MATTKIITEVTDLNAAGSTNGLKMPTGTAYSGTPTAGMVRNDTTGSSQSSLSTMQHFNGTDWKNFVNKNPYTSIAKWVACTGSGLAYTTDLTAATGWTSVSSQPFSTRGEGPPLWNGIAWVAPGRGGNSMAYSSDGVTWTGLNTGGGGDGANIGWNGTYWLLTASNGAYYTSDATGATGWTAVTNSLNGATASNANNIIWDGTQWVVAGNKLWYVVGSSPNGTRVSIPVSASDWAQLAWQGPTGNFIIGTRDGGPMRGYYMTAGDGTGLTASSGSLAGVQSGCIATSTGAGLSSTNNNYWYSSDGASYTTGSTFAGSGVSANYNGTITVTTAPSTDSIKIITGENINQNLPALSSTSTGLGVSLRSIASDRDYYRFV